MELQGDIHGAFALVLFFFLFAFLQPGLFVEFIMLKLCTHYLIARDHASPEGYIHKTLPCCLPQLLVKISKSCGGRDAVSV